MGKSKYYIIRDLDELELFFKLGIVKFNYINKIVKRYYGRKFDFEEWKRNIIFEFNIKDFLVIYTNDTEEYLGCDFNIRHENLKEIDFKVYIRKKKLKLIEKL